MGIIQEHYKNYISELRFNLNKIENSDTQEEQAIFIDNSYSLLDDLAFMLEENDSSYYEFY